MLLGLLFLAFGSSSGKAAPLPRGGLPPQPPHELPGDAAASRVSSDGRTWIVAGLPGGATGSLAERFHAQPIFERAGIYLVDRAAARAFAAALAKNNRLSFSEPNVRGLKRQGFPTDPYTPFQGWVRQVVDPSLTPPPVTSNSPVLGVLDSHVDLSHPEFSGSAVSSTEPGPPEDEHGTAVAAVAGAPANGIGIVGVWPGMRVLNIPDGTTCGSAVAALDDAISAKVDVINMSYSVPPSCFSHYVATQAAFGVGAVLVAAGGNEFDVGNPIEYPADDPHVLTIAGLNPDLSSAFFSNENIGIDLSAPAVGVLTAVPGQFDTDGTPDGYQQLDGTSFSAPMAAAAAAWLIAVRPYLYNDQVSEVLTGSATDLGDPGWDRRFGWGLVNIRDALSTSAPFHDPGEPNDDIEWINGTRFRGADPRLFGGRRAVSTRARLDQLEDPADVYAITVRGHSTARISISRSSGDPDLEVYSSGARTVYSRRGRIARSTRRGSDTVYVTNRSRRSVTDYVNVYVKPTAALDAGYRLSVRKVRFRR